MDKFGTSKEYIHLDTLLKIHQTTARWLIFVPSLTPPLLVPGSGLSERERRAFPPTCVIPQPKCSLDLCAGM